MEETLSEHIKFVESSAVFYKVNAKITIYMSFYMCGDAHTREWMRNCSELIIFYFILLLM